MLKNLTFENFKSWKLADIRFAPVTAFFGANSSGKSSLIQFLLLLKQTKDSPDRSIPLAFGGADAPTNLGSFSEAIYRKDSSRSIEWQIDWSLRDELRIADPQGKRSEALFRGTQLSLSARVDSRNKVPTQEFLNYHFDDSDFGIERLQGRTGFGLTAGNDEFRFIRVPGRAWELPGPTKGFSFPDQAKTYFQNAQFLSDFELRYISLMDSILHLGPLRDFPKREYVWAGSRPVDLGARGERWIDALLAANASGEKINRQYRGRLKPFAVVIAEWLRDMGLIANFRVDEVADGSGLYRVYVKRDAGSPETLITDVGFGVSQVIPALVLLNYAPRGSIVILEQPEIHLHPAVQAALADVILSTAKNRGIQVIIESHSEHLLHRMLRRIAEGYAEPNTPVSEEDVAFYFCKSKDGTSQLEKLKVNMFGGIENWPDDFFGDLAGDIYAREIAGLKKRKAAQ